MNNVMRNQPSYSDAPPHAWMLAEVWTWIELGFTFEHAVIRHVQHYSDVRRNWTKAEHRAIEASFDATFQPSPALHSAHCLEDGPCTCARWGHD